jgi:hypothetical protein
MVAGSSGPDRARWIHLVDREDCREKTTEKLITNRLVRSYSTFTIMCEMNATPKVAKWVEPPAMDSGATTPAIYSDESGLTCAYVIGATHPESRHTAILHFEGVLYYAMGYPNDEALHAHPLYANRLGFL